MYNDCLKNLTECGGGGGMRPCSDCCSGTSDVATRNNKMKGRRFCGTYDMVRGFGPEYTAPGAKPNCKPVGTRLDSWQQGGSCCSLQVDWEPDPPHAPYCASRTWSELWAWGAAAAPVAAVGAAGGLVGGGRGEGMCNMVMAIALGVVLYILVRSSRRERDT